MRKLFKLPIHFFVFTSMILSTVACDQNKGQPGSVQVGRAARGFGGDVMAGQPTAPKVGQVSPVSGRTWYPIYGGSYFSEEEFNYNVHDFVANIMDPQNLGSVSSQINASTGIRFWGRAEVNGAFNPSTYMNTTIRPQNSELRISIWDSYAGSRDSTGELISEIPVHIVGTASGEIRGQTARVRFQQDPYGWIELYGQFNAQTFQGTVFFDNTGGYANYLGVFSIPTCSFFRCY